VSLVGSTVERHALGLYGVQGHALALTSTITGSTHKCLYSPCCIDHKGVCLCLIFWIHPQLIACSSNTTTT